jgi:hypothetical protein
MGFPNEFKSFTVENSKLLGPKLKLFGWCFSINDQPSESWNDFGKKEDEWIQQFWKQAIAHNVTLKPVNINFRPDDCERVESDGYPWDRMDNVRDHLLRPNSISLTYSTPLMSKDDWLEELEQVPSSSVQSAMVCREESESDVEHWSETPPGVHRGDIRDFFALL